MPVRTERLEFSKSQILTASRRTVPRTRPASVTRENKRLAGALVLHRTSFFEHPANAYADASSRPLFGLRMKGESIDILVHHEGRTLQYCATLPKHELRKALLRPRGCFVMHPAFEWVELGFPPSPGSASRPTR